MGAMREAAGGGKIVEVAPERLGKWFEGFAERNEGVAETKVSATEVAVLAENTMRATVTVPFAPMHTTEATYPGLALAGLLEHVRKPRQFGLILVRLGAHSVGVFQGEQLVVSRTDRHQVHGRSAAGGWSQQRFARRRDNQATRSLEAAADDVLDIIGSRVPSLDAVVLGGDRQALNRLRADARLSKVFALAEPKILDVTEPRRHVLEEAAKRALMISILLRKG